jgi:hypothetical protein
MAIRRSNPHTPREPLRPEKLLLAARRADASRERWPEMLPAICPACRTLLGLVLAGGAILCRDCGTWATADEIIEVAE